MALRSLMKGKELRTAQKSLEEARAKMEALKTREEELAQSIEEAETEEERATVQEAVDAFETEKAEAEKAVTDLEAEVDKLERELAEIENTPAEDKKPEERKAATPQKEVRTMKRWREMGYEERSAFVQTEEMRSFIDHVRMAGKEKRAISNGAYLIPDVFIGIIRREVEDYSRLLDCVTVENLAGTGRMVIDSVVPEAVWTEQCANLNELDLSYGKVEVDGYKVGGYIKICNANLEDADVDLAGEIADKLGKAIAFALDKAILYGTGTKMPVGIVTALAAVADTPNIVTIESSVTGAAFAVALKRAKGKANSAFAKDDNFWVMNNATYNELDAQLTLANADGAYVGNVESIFDGKIVKLGFMPNNVIVGGIQNVYHLFRRAGIELSTTDQRFWTEDQTGFKATARYDGKHIDNNAFVAIGINSKTPTANDVTFAGDGANL